MHESPKEATQVIIIQEKWDKNLTALCQMAALNLSHFEMCSDSETKPALNYVQKSGWIITQHPPAPKIT